MENTESISTDVTRRKGAALRKKMREEDIRQEDFAEKIDYKSRQQVSHWWKGEYWPTDLEGKMEETLGLPPGFFARVGEGVDYKEALHANSILVFVPLMKPDMQVEKMRQLLAYLTHRGIASSWAELARTLNIQEWYLTDCAKGARALHPTIIEVIAHRWDVREEYWTAPQNESITRHLGKRSTPEKGEGDARHLVALPHDPDARQAMDTFIQAAIDFAAKWPKKPEGGTGGEKK